MNEDNADDLQGPMQIGNSPVIVDREPVPAASATYRTIHLSEPKPGVMAFAPDLGWSPWLFSGAIVLAGCCAVLAVLDLLPPVVRETSYLLWAPAPIFGLAAVERLYRGSTFAFDRDKRLVRCRIRFARQRFPLDAIVAIQLVAGIIHRGDEGPDFQQYQLNLVLDDAASPRLNVSNHPDLPWTRASGRRLADFLGVPLLDQIDMG